MGILMKKMVFLVVALLIIGVMILPSGATYQSRTSMFRSPYNNSQSTSSYNNEVEYWGVSIIAFDDDISKSTLKPYIYQELQVLLVIFIPIV